MCIRDSAYAVVINVLLFWLVGYLLTEWLAGLGGIVFVALCLLYTSDDADERSSVDLGGRRVIKKKHNKKKKKQKE